jgi:hypothetical protein
MHLFEKRGQWCFRDEKGVLHKFSTKAEAETKILFGDSLPTPELKEYDTLEEAIEAEDVADILSED